MKYYKLICKKCGEIFYHKNKIKKFCEIHKNCRNPRYEYICRYGTKNNKTGDAFCITIPAELVKKYKLLGKKFKIRILINSKFILYTKIN